MSVKVLAYRRHKQHRTVHHWHAHTQTTAWPFTYIASIAFRSLNLRQNVDALYVVIAACVCQALLACSAVKQTRAKPVFKRTDVVTHHCCGHSAAFRRRKKTATFDDPGEDRHANETIHSQALIMNVIKES